jgi:exodeoxyribonuclease-3
MRQAGQMRFATWNVNSVKARLPRLQEWLSSTKPDVLCVQETKVADFPDISGLGYEVAHFGQGRWNGVAVLSRVGLSDVRQGFPGEPGFPEQEARYVSALCGDVRFASVYVPNGRTPEDPHYTYKLAWLAALRNSLKDDLAAGPLVVAGDFNVAPTDADVWDITAFDGYTHVTPEERTALAGIQQAAGPDAGLVDLLPRASADPDDRRPPYTFWEMRMLGFQKGRGMRIDLALASPALAARATDVWIDRDARKGEGPSDHAPLVLDLG